MAHKITKYQCDFCRKSFASKSYAEKHELTCFENVKSKSCITCSNFSVYEYDIPRHCAVEKNLKLRLQTECPSHRPI
jgi:hypothetical protein